MDSTHKNQAQNTAQKFKIPELALTGSVNCAESSRGIIQNKQVTQQKNDTPFDERFLEKNKGAVQDDALEELVQLYSVYERALMSLNDGACEKYTTIILDAIRWVLQSDDALQKIAVSSHVMTQINKINMDIELDKHGRRMSTIPIERSEDLIEKLFDIVVNKKIFDPVDLVKDDLKLYEKIKQYHKENRKDKNKSGNCLIQ